MTFNNKQELIDLIKKKQASVKRDLEKLPRRRTINSEKLVSTIRAYEYVIALIDSAKIVVYPEEIGIEPCEPAPEREYINNTVNGRQEIRNDRIREFKEKDGDITYIDGKAIDSIEIEKEVDGFITIRLANNYSFYFYKNEFDYNDVVAWWKYWKN